MPTKQIDESGVYEYTVHPKTGEATIAGVSPVLRGKVAIPEELDGHPVTGLGKGSFSTSTVTGVVIPGSVRVVGSTAFYWCTELTEVEFEEGVEEIEDSAFAVCTKLARVTFPSTLRRIGSLAFHRCTSLTSVQFDKGLESIGDDAFAGCPLQGTLLLPERLSSLGERVFLDCTGLSQAMVPSGLLHLPSGTFFRCTGLKRVSLPPSLVSIGSRALAGCSQLTEIRIPATVTDIGAYAFDGCERLGEFSVERGNPSFRSTGGMLFSGDGSRLIRCPAGFKGSCRLPEGVHSVERGAFELCTRLRRIVFPRSLDSFHEHNLRECSSLESIEVPEANPNFVVQNGLLLSHDGKTLYLCIGDESRDVESPEGVERIEPGAFKGHGRLRNVVIPESVVRIGDEAFARCPELREAILPEGLSILPTRTFYECRKLATAFLPDRIQTVGKQAFAGCTSLAKVSLSRTAKIEPWAFDKCPWQPSAS